MTKEGHLTESYVREKRGFVEEALAEFRPRRVLDVGANTGYFSRTAARSGARVVAIDSDEASVGEIFRGARAEELDVLPLVIDIARPSPATGWRNREQPSFLERARRSFDAVLMLAVCHHLMVSELIPLDEIAELASELTERFLLVEFVGADDPMFRRLTRGRAALFEHFTRETFEAAFGRRFRLVRSRPLAESGRWLYLYSKGGDA
jgi:SAM-dependent methyltransferase